MDTMKSAMEKAFREHGIVLPSPEKRSSTISTLPFIRMQPIGPDLRGLVSVDSRFYDLIKGAKEYDLEFAVNETGGGPNWDDQGVPISIATSTQEIVRISAVPVGGNLFRLAKNVFFEPLTELSWGDEFHAVEVSTGHLELIGVVLPLKYRHERILMPGSLTDGGMLSFSAFLNKIHELDGGWEIVAGGILTVTLPVENWAKLSDK